MPVAQKHSAISRQEKMAFSTPRRVVLELPSPSPRVCTDGRTGVRWRHNQTFSDQKVTKIAQQWCSAGPLARGLRYEVCAL